MSTKEEFKDNIADFIAFGATTGLVLLWKDLIMQALERFAEGSMLLLFLISTFLTMGFFYIIWKYPYLYTRRSDTS